MNNKATIIKSLLIKSLVPFYKLKYFTKSEDGASEFTRQENGFKKTVFLNQNSIRMNTINFTPQLFISHDRITNIKKELVGEEFKDNFGLIADTIIENQGRIAIRMNKIDFNRENRYSIREENEVDLVAQRHIQYMKKVGFPFFEKVSSQDGIDWYYNESLYHLDVEKLTEFEKDQKIRGWLERELINGLIAGKLAQPEKFEQLLKVYRNLFYQDWQQELMDKIIPKLVDDVC